MGRIPQEEKVEIVPDFLTALIKNPVSFSSMILLGWVITVGNPAREELFMQSIAVERKEFVQALVDADTRNQARMKAVEDHCYSEIARNQAILSEILEQVRHGERK